MIRLPRDVRYGDVIVYRRPGSDKQLDVATVLEAPFENYWLVEVLGVGREMLYLSPDEEIFHVEGH